MSYHTHSVDLAALSYILGVAMCGDFMDVDWGRSSGRRPLVVTGQESDRVKVFACMQACYAGQKGHGSRCHVHVQE